MNRINTTFRNKMATLTCNPYRIARWTSMLLCLGLLLGLASPALAQGGDIGQVVSDLVQSITDIIQGVAIGAGILGLSIWGLGKVTRPIFPQISQLAGNYISDLLIGVAVIFVAASIVEGIASAIGGGG
jgi:hypothetical protein